MVCPRDVTVVLIAITSEEKIQDSFLMTQVNEPLRR